MLLMRRHVRFTRGDCGESQRNRSNRLTNRVGARSRRAESFCRRFIPSAFPAGAELILMTLAALRTGPVAVD